MSTSQSAWVAGHVLTLLGGAGYYATWWRGSRLNPLFFRASALGAVWAFSVIFIVDAQSRPLTPHTLVADDNVHYLILALFWLVSRHQLVLALAPFVLFLFFHTLVFVRARVLPAVGWGRLGLSSAIQRFVRGYNDTSLEVAALLEAIAGAWMVLRMVTLREGAWRGVLVYAVFLRVRYTLSAFTRDVWRTVAQGIDSVVLQEGVPLGVRKAWVLVSPGGASVHLRTSTHLAASTGASASRR